VKNLDEFIFSILQSLEIYGSALAEDLGLIEAALTKYPNSAELWILRGDLIQLSDHDGVYSLKDAEASYLKAIDLEPANPEGFQSLGFFYDAVLDDPKRAITQLERAISLGAGSAAREGLANVLEQMGAGVGSCERAQ
jgi:Flp pilus assembly protein TadD